MSEQDIVTALGGISDEKLADAMTVYERKKKKRPILYRVAAMAAMVAILIGCFSFPWNMFEKHSIFTFTVSAAEMENKEARIVIETSIVEPYVSGIDHPKDWLPDSWHDKELFCVKIRTENFTEEYSDRVYAEIEYNNSFYAENTTTTNLSFQFPYNKFDLFRYRTLCTVYGWTETDTSFTITVYDQKEDGKNVLFQETFDITLDKNYVINGATANAYVDPSLHFKTTAQIVDQIINDEDLPFPLIQAGVGDYRKSIFSMYAEEISVLYQRGNAKNVIINKMIEVEKLQKETTGKEHRIAWIQSFALKEILAADIIWAQLDSKDLVILEEYFPGFTEGYHRYNEFIHS